MSIKSQGQPNLLSIQANSAKALTQPSSILRSVGQNSLNHRYNKTNDSNPYQVGLPSQYSSKLNRNDLAMKSVSNLNLRTEGNKSESMDRMTLARSVCILSKDELQRIKNNIQKGDDFPTYTYDREADRKKLHELSMKRIDNWPDNLLKITQRKEKERFEKFEQIEREKRKIDEQEEAYQQEKYRAIIKDANEKIFASDPRVRQFKKVMLSGDVFQERQEQTEIKKYMHEMTKTMDTENTKYQETLQKQEDEDNKIKQQKKLAQLHDMKKQLASQLQEMKDKRIKSIIDDNQEGQFIKERAEQEHRENIEKKIREKQKILKLHHDLEQNQKTKEVYDENSRRKDKEEDDKIQEYITNKGQLVEMRKLREEEKIKEKINIRQQLYNTQLTKMQEKKDTEDHRISAQIKQKQDKEDREKYEKEQELQKRRDDIVENIRESMVLKQKLQEDKKRKENEYAQQLLQQSKIIEKGEVEEKQFHKKRILNIRSYQQNQIDEKRSIIQNRYNKELEEDQDLRNSIQIDKRIFKSWAESAIDEWKESGRDIKPLLKELKQIERDY